MRADTWTATGARITDDAALASIKRLLDDVTPLIVEHRHYRGARAPTRLVFDDHDTFVAYLRDQTRPGDRVLVWRYDECCRDDNPVCDGKVPDAAGNTPVGGGY